MPLLLAAFLGGLVNIAASLVGRVMIALGISAVTYTGIGAGIDFLKDTVLAEIFSLPPIILQILALTKVGQGLSLLFAATTVAMTLKGLKAGGSFTKWVKS